MGVVGGEIPFAEKGINTSLGEKQCPKTLITGVAKLRKFRGGKLRGEIFGRGKTQAIETKGEKKLGERGESNEEK